MTEKKPLNLIASIDVEEEGLFAGRYQRYNPSIHNSIHLPRLQPLLEKGVKFTFFCAYSAFADARTRKILEDMRDRHGVEIGAHLHHWNTPPINDSPGMPEVLRKVPSIMVKRELLDQKLYHLFQIAGNFQGESVTSFRMGRWDLHDSHWELLARHGVLCDASVRPLHSGNRGNPDHFNAPANPYRVQCGERLILEVPLTVTPLHPALGKCARSWGLGGSFHKWGALALLPVQHPLWLMKLTTRLHVARGGNAISLTWHSSEMMPGGAPHIKDEAAVRALLEKIGAYADWLFASYSVSAHTMASLGKHLGDRPPILNSGGDWAPAQGGAS